MLTDAQILVFLIFITKIYMYRYVHLKNPVGLKHVGVGTTDADPLAAPSPTFCGFRP